MGRHIPAAIRRVVFERDAGRCSYVDRRAAPGDSTSRTQPHGALRPEAAHSEANITLRCHAHDQRPSGDLQGAWEFAVIPGKVYNKLRQLVVDGSLNVEGDRSVFDAIVLRPIPAAAQQPNGPPGPGAPPPSLKYSALREAGFRYRLHDTQLDGLPDDLALTSTSFDSSAVATLIDAFEFVYDAANVVVRGAFQALGWADQLLAGSVPVTIDFAVEPQDERFLQPTLIRHYGPEGGSELSIEGVTVDYFQVVSRAWTLGIPMPTVYSAHANRTGQVTFDIAKSSTLGAAYFGGWCAHLETDAARVSDLPVMRAFYCSLPKEARTGFEEAGTINWSRDSFGYQRFQSSTRRMRRRTSFWGMTACRKPRC